MDGVEPRAKDHVRITREPRAETVRTRVASDFNPASISCGYRVSCAHMLEVDGFLAMWAARA